MSPGSQVSKKALSAGEREIYMAAMVEEDSKLMVAAEALARADAEYAIAVRQQHEAQLALDAIENVKAKAALLNMLVDLTWRTPA